MADTSDFSLEMLEKTKQYYQAHKNDTAAFPSIAGLAIFLEKARSTMYKWASEDDKVEFSDILERILSLQESKLLSKGLDGTYNSTITKLILTKHGYSDKQETDVTSAGKPIVIPSEIFTRETDPTPKQDSKGQPSV